ncbi:hypothetical protein [Mycobacterium palustre]|nr:hypothetical protein [Mycobacterium palustre]
MPPAAGKELPFVVLNLFHFPSDEDVKHFEETVLNWWPELIFFVGRLSGDVSERYTHCVVWLYKDFDEYKRNVEEYAKVLNQMPEGYGDWPGYRFDHAYCARAADLRDPILKEHGIEGWTQRLHEIWGNPNVPDDARVREWSKQLWGKLANDWTAEALVRSGWVPAAGPKALQHTPTREPE